MRCSRRNGDDGESCTAGDVIEDSRHMACALALAARGRGRTSPNPMVGAVVVDEDAVVVGRGFHEFAGGPHAEVHALRDAGPRARGATLYCTLEPCCHTGRTGPCAPLVVGAGIRRTVIAMEDPNPLVSGGGIAHLRGNGIEVAVGVMRDAAVRLNRPYISVMTRKRPLVTMKVALSLDAKVAAAAGTRTAITGPAANRIIQRDRAEVDAIAAGSGTILVDDPLLTPRGAYRYRPLVRVVFDRRLRTPTGARLFSTLDAGPVMIVTTDTEVRRSSERAAALKVAGARIEVVDDAGPTDGSFLSAALERLAAVNVTAVTVEGGPALHVAIWEAGLVDKVQVFVASKMLGPSGLPWLPLPAASLADLAELSFTPAGDDILIEGYVHRTD
jgi:diaminohydroxyphosphoribosylaminopyrimidine deaminase/5-amino-6-(5-phosphoribosylamino)uracil reductase